MDKKGSPDYSLGHLGYSPAVLHILAQGRAVSELCKCIRQGFRKI